jgi:hypothetical protein
MEQPSRVGPLWKKLMAAGAFLTFLLVLILVTDGSLLVQQSQYDFMVAVLILMGPGALIYGLRLRKTGAGL